MPGKILNLKKTGEILGVTDRTIENLIERGDLRGFQVGARWRVEEDEITAFIERQKEKAAVVEQKRQELEPDLEAVRMEWPETIATFERLLAQLPVDEQAAVLDHLLEFVKQNQEQEQ